jgi:hypothetical protein
MPDRDIWVQPYFISKEVKSYHSVNANGNPCIFAGEVEIDSNKLTRNELPRSKLTGYLPSRTAKAALSFAQQAAGN